MQLGGTTTVFLAVTSLTLGFRFEYYDGQANNEHAHREMVIETALNQELARRVGSDGLIRDTSSVFAVQPQGTNERYSYYIDRKPAESSSHKLCKFDLQNSRISALNDYLVNYKGGQRLGFFFFRCKLSGERCCDLQCCPLSSSEEREEEDSDSDEEETLNPNYALQKETLELERRVLNEQLAIFDTWNALMDQQKAVAEAELRHLNSRN